MDRRNGSHKIRITSKLNFIIKKKTQQQLKEITRAKIIYLYFSVFLPFQFLELEILLAKTCSVSLKQFVSIQIVIAKK